jgi:hypothetical protein
MKMSMNTLVVVAAISIQPFPLDAKNIRGLVENHGIYQPTTGDRSAITFHCQSHPRAATQVRRRELGGQRWEEEKLDGHKYDDTADKITGITGRAHSA